MDYVPRPRRSVNEELRTLALKILGVLVLAWVLFNVVIPIFAPR
jgi:hypothetical protein